MTNTIQQTMRFRSRVVLTLGDQVIGSYLGDEYDCPVTITFLPAKPAHVGRVPRALTDVQRRGGKGTP